MANKLSICNEALFEIGQASIVDINERTPQAEACRTVFNSSLEYILRAHIWTFATKRVPLATVSGDLPNDWMYMYAYPQDCLAMIEVLPPRASTHASPVRYHDGEGISYRVAGDSVAYEMERNSANVYVIYTNQKDAVARYTCMLSTVDDMDVLAATALKWRIASRIAKSLSADMETVQMCMQAYAGTMSQAAAMTQKENQKTPDLNSVLLGARFGR